MAATVVAVVVFLCGVLVGRGVPLRPAGDPITIGLGGAPPLDDRRAVVGLSGGGLSAAAESGDDLTYYTRLESDGPVAESLRGIPGAVPTVPGEAPDPVDEPLEPSAMPTEPTSSTGSESGAEGDPPAELGRTVPMPVAEPVPEQAVSAASTPVSDLPRSTSAVRSQQGFAVQVAAYRERATAERLADDLADKGFPTFVIEPTADAPVAVYRVRVGPYGDRQEAERIRQRLEREEQFKPWVTR